MMDPKKRLKTAMTTLTAAGLCITIAHGHAATLKPSHTCASQPSKKMERCYGITKAVENSCHTNGHTCATRTTKNNGGDDWMKVPKGTCARIVGGHLTAQSDKLA